MQKGDVLMGRVFGFPTVWQEKNENKSAIDGTMYIISICNFG